MSNQNTDSFIGNWDVGSAANNFFRICNLISTDENYFSTFKTNSIFCQIIGNDVRSKEQAGLFLKNINQDLLLNLDKYKKNDLLGSPPLHFFVETGNISSGTLYFLSILSRIINHIGDIKNKTICEIGSGYGGQAKIILEYGVCNYTCIDVHAPLSLAKKYLSILGHNNINYIEHTNISDIHCDLVISNWCLSEFDDIGIDFYIKKVISNAKNGYFEMNMSDFSRKEKLIKNLQEIFEEVLVISEVVATGPATNFTLICKNNKNCK
jgi:hypothetical protein